MGLMHRVLHFSEPVYVESSGTAVGPKEGRGPLGRSFDYRYDDLRCGEKKLGACRAGINAYGR